VGPPQLQVGLEYNLTLNIIYIYIDIYVYNYILYIYQSIDLSIHIFIIDHLFCLIINQPYLLLGDIFVQDKSHAGKIVDRKWYERNKFLGPRRVNERGSFFLGKDPRTMAYDTIPGYMIYSYYKYKPIVPIVFRGYFKTNL